MLYRNSAILGLSFLKPKELCLPNQFSKVFCQYRLNLMSKYRHNLMSKKKLGSFNDGINAYFQSFILLPPTIWTFYGQENLRKTLWSHEILWSLTDLSGANIVFHSDSRDLLFWVFMISKINPLMNKSALFWQDV